MPTSPQVAAVEFYCNGAFDLDFHKEPGAKKLPPKSLVTITSDAQALGAKETTLTSAGDLAEYLCARATHRAHDH